MLRIELLVLLIHSICNFNFFSVSACTIYMTNEDD